MKNFAARFLLKSLSIFMHIAWVSLERSLPPAELEYKRCLFWSKVMTSEVEQRLTLVTAGYRQHGSQWANKAILIHN